MLVHGGGHGPAMDEDEGDVGRAQVSGGVGSRLEGWWRRGRAIVDVVEEGVVERGVEVWHFEVLAWRRERDWKLIL